VGGIVTGSGRLWRQEHVPVALPPSGTNCQFIQCLRPDTLWDTVAVRQALGSGPAIEVSVAEGLGNWLSVGGTFELHLLQLDRGCSVVFDSFPTIVSSSGLERDIGNPNPANCSTVDREDRVFPVLGLTPFTEIRIPVGSQTRPYVRISGGASIVPNTTGMGTQFAEFVRSATSGKLRPSFGGLLGIELANQGSRLRGEIGTTFRRYDLVTSVANDGTPQIKTGWRNHLKVMVGFSFGLKD
jgi:hypothetical protein